MKALPRCLAGCSANDSLAERMRQSRVHAQLTQKAAAQAIGITPGHLGRIERGGVQMVEKPATIVLAAGAYGVNQVWLYSGGQAGARLVPDWYIVPEVAAA